MAKFKILTISALAGTLVLGMPNVLDQMVEQVAEVSESLTDLASETVATQASVLIEDVLSSETEALADLIDNATLDQEAASDQINTNSKAKSLFNSPPSWSEFIQKTCGREIPLSDNMFSASSSHYSTLTFNTWLPHLARINKDGLQNAWMPEFDDPFNESWLQLDFGVNNDQVVTAISTQGASRYLKDVYVSSYLVEHSLDGENWQTVALSNQSTRAATYNTLKTKPLDADLVFPGNSDDDTEHLNFMPAVLIARFIRIRPMSWNRVPAVRIAVYGCPYVQNGEVLNLPRGGNNLFTKEYIYQP